MSVVTKWPDHYPALSNELLAAFVKALGLEGKRVKAITLRLEFKQFAQLTIERAPLEHEAHALAEAIKDIKIPDLVTDQGDHS